MATAGTLFFRGIQPSRYLFTPRRNGKLVEIAGVRYWDSPRGLRRAKPKAPSKTARRHAKR